MGFASISQELVEKTRVSPPVKSLVGKTVSEMTYNMSSGTPGTL